MIYESMMNDEIGIQGMTIDNFKSLNRGCD